MGNTSARPHPQPRNKKHLQYKGADRPAPPGKPYLASEIEITPDVLTIRWDPPLKSGGAPVTGYLVEHRRTGSPHWVRATPFFVHETELTLSGLEPGWRYQFRVFSENVVGLSEASELSEPLTVTLQRSAITAPKFTQELKDTVAIENEKVEFVAHFIGQPTPKLCWFKDGFEIFSSRRTRILTENDRTILTIHQSALCDEGEIKCTATNKAGHVSTKARLTLEAPPSIRLPRQYEDGLLFEIGEVIRLKVSVAGLPAPLVFWTHNGESIQENERYEMDNSDRTSSLRIAEALRSDRGEYQIKAVNKLGTDITSFMVTVTDKPSPPGKVKVVMALGRSVTLSWNTPEDDGGCKIGNYIVEYYRLGWNVWLKAATSRQLTTILGDLIEGSEYKFRIKAESPFGVSDPSEESDSVFIPDPKRGILEPSSNRSRSQPRDVLDELIPKAASRKKPRSQSSTRSGEEEAATSPVRPERIKIKSPPKTPDHLSPKTERKEVNVDAINKALFDRASITRDFAYGTPEIKIKKTDVPIPKDLEIKNVGNKITESPIKNTIQIIDRELLQQNGSPSPISENEESNAFNKELSTNIKPQNKTPQFTLDRELVSPNKSRSASPIGRDRDFKTFNKELSPKLKFDFKMPRFSRENSENLGGSTEFMMLIYPGENNRDMEMTSELDFDLQNGLSVPPPLSLSAPELGAEPPIQEMLRASASSTELLHERAMIRFYREALAEEEVIQKRTNKLEEEGAGSLIPKIQINNKDNQDIVGLERKHSLRRRLSAGGSVPQQVLWAQKRQSLRSSNEFSDIFDNKVIKTQLTLEEKRELMQTRQRSQSEEIEEEEFEKVRMRMISQNKTPKKKISVVDEEYWTESLSESSEDELDRTYSKIKEVSMEEEDETYHPRMIINPEKKSKYEEPFEILTKPAKLPDANFIPKPILKKKDKNSQPEQSDSSSRSNSLTDQEDVRMNNQMEKNTHGTRAVASVAGITAAGVVIPQPLLQKREAEEAKVVIDHYGDIVRSYSKKTVNNVDNNPVREALRKAAAEQAEKLRREEEEREMEIERHIERQKQMETEKQRQIERGKERQIEKENERERNMFLSNNNKDIDIDARFKNLERKLDTQIQPRSATPVYKEIKPPVKQETKLVSKNTKAQISRGQITKEEVDIKREARGREQSRFSQSKRSVSQSKSPSSSRAPRKTSPSPAPRSNSIANKKKNPQSRSNSSARNQSRANSSTRPQSRSESSTRPQSRSDSSTRVQSRAESSSRPKRNETPVLLRKPKMCEIMTQTSTSTEPPSFEQHIASIVENELQTTAQQKVRTTVDYLTDLAMFAVACWIFLFSNELLALPVLLIAVYRQLKDEVKRRIPNWIKKRWQKKN